MIPGLVVSTAIWRLEPRLDLESALNRFARATFWSTLLKHTQCPGETSTTKIHESSKSGHLWSWSLGFDSNCMALHSSAWLRECFDDFPPSPNGRHDASLPRGPSYGLILDLPGACSFGGSEAWEPATNPPSTHRFYAWEICVWAGPLHELVYNKQDVRFMSQQYWRLRSNRWYLDEQ